MKKYEGYLICTDFDGTFALPNARLSEENLEAVSYFQQNGGLFTIASGRTPTFIRELGDRFRPNAPIIAMNGAMLCDENDGHVLRRFPMSRDVLEIMDDIAATGLPQRMSLWNEYEIRDDWTREDGVLPSARFKSLPEPWFKTVITADPESTLKIRDYFLARYAERFNCGRSWPEGFEIHSLESGKGECMRALKEMYGGRIHTTVGVGDYENDLSLVRDADLGYAVGNAIDAVKAVARRVTVSNAEHAIARIIAELPTITAAPCHCE